MNPEIKAQWVAALRSGEYKQGEGLLRSANDDFCCLGVLCDIAQKQGVVDMTRGPSWYFYEGASNVLPEVVANWANISTSPTIEGGEELWVYNDVENLSFDEIAQLIEQNPLGSPDYAYA